MKKIILALMLSIFSTQAMAAGNDWRYTRRDPTNVANVLYDIPTPASSAILMIDITSGVATPKHILLGSGLSYNGSTLSVGGLSAVATSGAYSDLTGTPSIPAAQVQVDWNQASGGAIDFIKNKPSLATVSTSGAYSDLSGKPSLATVATSGAYSDLSGKPSLATVATTGAYNDLTGKPTIPSNIPTVYNGSTLRTNPVEYTNSGTVSGTTVVFYLTDDGTSTGNALFPNHIDHMKAEISDIAAGYNFAYALTNSNKTLTVTVSKIATILGILTLGSASPSGAAVTVLVKGN